MPFEQIDICFNKASVPAEQRRNLVRAFGNVIKNHANIVPTFGLGLSDEEAEGTAFACYTLRDDGKGNMPPSDEIKSLLEQAASQCDLSVVDKITRNQKRDYEFEIVPRR